jgi:hypothetical protein
MASTDKNEPVTAENPSPAKKKGRPKGSGKKRTSQMLDVTLGELRSMLNDKDSVPVPVGTKWYNQMVDLLGR